MAAGPAWSAASGRRPGAAPGCARLEAPLDERARSRRSAARGSAAARGSRTPRSGGRSAARAPACPSRRRGGPGRGSARSRASGWSSRWRSSRGGATRPKKRPWSTDADGFGSWLDPVEQHVAEDPGAARHEPCRRGRQPRHGRAEGEPHQQRRERDARSRAGRCPAPASRSACPRTRSGAAAAASSVALAPSDVPPITARSTSSVVEQRDRLAAEDAHPVVPHLGRAVRVAVPEQVEAEHAVTALRRALGQRRCILRENSRPGRSTTTWSPSPYSS